MLICYDLFGDDSDTVLIYLNTGRLCWECVFMAGHLQSSHHLLEIPAWYEESSSKPSPILHHFTINGWKRYTIRIWVGTAKICFSNSWFPSQEQPFQTWTALSLGGVLAVVFTMFLIIQKRPSTMDVLYNFDHSLFDSTVADLWEIGLQYPKNWSILLNDRII